MSCFQVGQLETNTEGALPLAEMVCCGMFCLRHVLSPATIILCRHGVYHDDVCGCCDDDVTDNSDEDDDDEDRSHGNDYGNGRFDDDSDVAGHDDVDDDDGSCEQ